MSEYIVRITLRTATGYVSTYASEMLSTIDVKESLTIEQTNILATQLMYEGAEPVCAACETKLSTMMLDLPPSEQVGEFSKLEVLDTKKTVFVGINSHSGFEIVSGKSRWRRWNELTAVCYDNDCINKMRAVPDMKQGVIKRCRHFKNNIPENHVRCLCMTALQERAEENAFCCQSCSPTFALERINYPFHQFIAERTCKYCNVLLDEEIETDGESRTHCPKKRCMAKAIQEQLTSDQGYKYVYHCATCHKGSIEQMNKCSACKSTYYCGRQCQKNDWSRHKKVCGKEDLKCQMFAKTNNRDSTEVDLNILQISLDDLSKKLVGE
jgi:hypothetical protein